MGSLKLSRKKQVNLFLHFYDFFGMMNKIIKVSIRRIITYDFIPYGESDEGYRMPVVERAINCVPVELEEHIPGQVYDHPDRKKTYFV
jgi:hypothetical protein